MSFLILPAGLSISDPQNDRHPYAYQSVHKEEIYLKPLVSIIVPVYNAAPFLPKCLNSLRTQSWTNIEVWLVNDGSTDNSLSICEAVAAEDPRFHVIDKENSGVSDTRNTAMDLATGKYLQFVDSDDYLTQNATELLVCSAETTGADLVIAHFYRVNGSRYARQGHIRNERIMTRQEFASEMMKAPSNFYYGVLWNKLYRRNIVEQNHLRCEKDISWCEDFLFNLEYIKYARLISAIPKPVYHYIKREDSIVSHINLRRTIDMKRTTFAFYKKLYQALDLYEEKKLAVYGYLLAAATDGGTLEHHDPPKLLEELAVRRKNPQKVTVRKYRKNPSKKKRFPCNSSEGRL